MTASSGKSSFSAPVRVCLPGEDLDWLGYRCCCVAINRRTTISLTDDQSSHRSLYFDRTWELMIKRLGVSHTEIRPNLRVTTDAPIASGLASSTALTTALVKVCLDLIGYKLRNCIELAEIVYEIERSISNCGGMDPLAITLGGVIFIEGRRSTLPELLGRTNWPEEFGLVLIDSGQPKSTATHILDVHKQLESDNQDLFDYIRIVDGCSEQIWRALNERDIVALCEAVNTAHIAMRDLQRMSTESLESLRDIALQNGCLGVKLTGAGHGGCLVGITHESELNQVVRKMIRAQQQFFDGSSVNVIKAHNEQIDYA